MSARGWISVTLIAALSVALLAAMVRYTKRVESDLARAPAAGTVKLLKERTKLYYIVAWIGRKVTRGTAAN